MNIEEKVNELIEFLTKKLKESRGLDAQTVFLNGNCGNMYTVFSEFFIKESVIPYRITYKDEPYHIISKIGENFYDITGKTSLEQYIEYLRENSDDKNYDANDFKLEEIPVNKRWSNVREQSNGYYYGYDEKYEDEYTIGYDALAWAKQLRDEKWR